MKEKIERLSKGIFEYKLPEIILSVEEINISVEMGKNYEGSFYIHNAAKTKMKGILYSSNRFFILENKKFIGEENIINYRVNGTYLEAGTILTGDISIITDCGECILPFQVKVEAPYCNTSLGRIKDLFQFANLAKISWKEAARLFETEEFKRVLSYYDKKSILLYENLKKSFSINQALEEFLISVHKKTPIQISVSKTEMEYEVNNCNFKDKVILNMEGWGYEEIKIHTNVSFLKIEHTKISTEDFINHSFEIEILVEAEKLRKGCHCGKIFIETAYQYLIVEVICHSRRNGFYDKKLIQKRTKFQLVENYLKFRTGHNTVSHYSLEADKLLDILSNWKSAKLEEAVIAEELLEPKELIQRKGLTERKETTKGKNLITERELLPNRGWAQKKEAVLITEQKLCALYRVHLLFISGKEAQAVAAFTSITCKEEEDSTCYGAWLYLKALLEKDRKVTEESCNKLRELLRNSEQNPFLFWFLLYLDSEYETNAKRKYQAIKEFCNAGCKSPIIYFEAAQLMREDPSLLKEFGTFELNILLFGQKYKYFTKDILIPVNYLAGKEKTFRFLVYLVLSGFFAQYRMKELLTAICSLLIRGHQTQRNYLNWYRIGMQEQLKIAELPEYYLYAAQEHEYERLEPAAYLYYSSYTNLEDKKKAYLYACLLRNRSDYEVQYRIYEKDMEAFAKAKLKEGKISTDLAVLYEAFLTESVLDKELADALSNLMFRYEIKCENPNIVSVSIVHKEIKEEQIVPFNKKRAYFDLFTEDAQIFLIDKAGARYHTTIYYTLNKLLHLDSMGMKCYELGSENKKLLLHLSEKVIHYQKFDENSISLRRKTAKEDWLCSEYQKDCLISLIFYYYENFEGNLLEQYLLQINLKTVTQNERTKLIEFMILRGLYKTALRAMSEFGYHEVDVKRLLKLASKLLSSTEEVQKISIILEICFFVFQSGKYDPIILDYLIKYYYGTTKEMFELWKAAKGLELDTVELEERLLGQMLFSESYINDAYAVFMSYYRNGLNRKLIRAFLSYYAYKYLVKGRVVEEELFEIMKRENNHEENEICVLALLKYDSIKEDLTDSEIKFVDYYLHEFERKNILFPFFKEFKKYLTIPEQMYNKYYVEYNTNPEYKVTIHYCLNGEEFIAESMKDICYGCFIKEFILFADETLQYYITEEWYGQETITESTEIKLAQENIEADETKYCQINLMVTAKELNDTTTVECMLKQYIKADATAARLFHPLI